jgi:hypothetical protein
MKTVYESENQENQEVQILKEVFKYFLVQINLPKIKEY